jgi:hypothetical protein
MHEVTRILYAIGKGDSRAAPELLPLVYDELRQLAAAQMARTSLRLPARPCAASW